MSTTFNPFTATGADVRADLERAQRGIAFVLDAFDKAPDLLTAPDLLAIGEHAGPLAGALETTAHHVKVATYHLPR